MKIVTSWDDGAWYDLKVVSLLDKYKLPGIFYFPSEWAMHLKFKGIRPLDDSEADLIARRFHIGSHGVTHALLTRIKPEAAKWEIEQSKKDLEARFKRPITSFCYPRGYANPEIQMMVKQAGYKDARSTLVGYIHPSENPFFTQTTVHVGCDRKEYGGVDWLDYALTLLEEAKKTPNSVYHVWGHSWEVNKTKGWSKLDTLFKALHDIPSQ